MQRAQGKTSTNFRSKSEKDTSKAKDHAWLHNEYSTVAKAKIGGMERIPTEIKLTNRYHKSFPGLCLYTRGVSGRPCF